LEILCSGNVRLISIGNASKTGFNFNLLKVEITFSLQRIMSLRQQTLKAPNPPDKINGEDGKRLYKGGYDYGQTGTHQLL